MAPDGDQGVDYICINKGNFEMFLRELLLVKSYRVEVYTKSSPSSEWVAEFKGSPGNLIQFENLLFNNTEMVVGSSIISVNMKQNGQQKVSWSKLFIPLLSLIWFWLTCFDFIPLVRWNCVRRAKWANIFGHRIRWQWFLVGIGSNNSAARAKRSGVAISGQWIWKHCQATWTQ